MKPGQFKKIDAARRRCCMSGFALAEVMVAGILLAAVMAGVSRLSTSALASSAKQSERARIESAITNNIQEIQMEDSYLQFQNMTEEEQTEGCSDPTRALEVHLKNTVSPPKPSNISHPIERSFESLNMEGMNILIVNYRFLSPEFKGKAIESQRWENRRIELNPNFSSQCYTTIE